MNSIWDGIYKDYKEGGDAYATLGADMAPEFLKFIETIELSKKSALDIGFGTGRYMKVLRNRGFEVAGIDNSPTAHELATKTLGGSSGLEIANMYDYEIPANIYDLVYSLSTIHHGTKGQIKNLLDRIHKNLIPGGYIFITVPINSSANGWMSFKDKTEVAPGTFTPNSGPEKGLPHSFYTKAEIKSLFTNYKTTLIAQDDFGRWIVIAQK